MPRINKKEIKKRFREAKETLIEITGFMRPSLYTKEEYRRFWKNYLILVIMILLIAPIVAVFWDIALLQKFGAQF